MRTAAFCDRGLDNNLMTLKLKGDLDVLMYLHATAKAVWLRHSKPSVQLKNTQIFLKITGQSEMSKAPSHF